MQYTSKLITGVLVAATLGFPGILSAQKGEKGMGELAITLNSENDWQESDVKNALWFASMYTLFPAGPVGPGNPHCPEGSMCVSAPNYEPLGLGFKIVKPVLFLNFRLPEAGKYSLYFRIRSSAPVHPNAPGV